MTTTPAPDVPVGFTVTVELVPVSEAMVSVLSATAPVLENPALRRVRALLPAMVSGVRTTESPSVRDRSTMAAEPPLFRVRPPPLRVWAKFDEPVVPVKPNMIRPTVNVPSTLTVWLPVPLRPNWAQAPAALGTVAGLQLPG